MTVTTESMLYLTINFILKESMLLIVIIMALPNALLACMHLCVGYNRDIMQVLSLCIGLHLWWGWANRAGHLRIFDISKADLKIYKAHSMIFKPS